MINNKNTIVIHIIQSTFFLYKVVINCTEPKDPSELLNNFYNHIYLFIYNF